MKATLQNQRRRGSQSLLVTHVLVAGLFAAMVQYAGTARGDDDGRSKAGTKAGDKKPKLVDYAPGVRIDWRFREIRVAANVVQNDELLELFACSPGTREHESVIVVLAKPKRIFEAIGLMGITPGHPVLFHPETKKLSPALGERVYLEVEYSTAGGKRPRVRAEDWMIDVKHKKPLDDIRWVFAGSNHYGKRFGADVDGTVATVVDFSSSLISLDTLHSSDNAQLWLAADPKKVPPQKTPCEFVITRWADRFVAVQLAADGTCAQDGQPRTASQLAKALKALQNPDPRAPKVGIMLQHAEDVGEAVIKAAKAKLVAAKIPAERIDQEVVPRRDTVKRNAAGKEGKPALRPKRQEPDHSPKPSGK